MWYINMSILHKIHRVLLHTVTLRKYETSQSQAGGQTLLEFTAQDVQLVADPEHVAH